MVRICIRMLQIPLEWFEFAFKSFKTRLNGSILHSNPSNSARIGRFWIQIPFEWLVLHLFESHSNSWNLHLNALIPLRLVQICIPMLWILFEWSKFTFQMVHISIRMVWIALEWLEFAFESVRVLCIAFKCFKSISNGLNLHYNASNFVRHSILDSNLHSNALNAIPMDRSCIWMVWIPLKMFKFASNASNPIGVVRICIRML